MRSLWATFLAVVFCAIASHAYAEKRAALVIGNSSYRNVPSLPNPSNDATEIASLFRSAGFSVVDVRRDLGISEMRGAISDFAEAASDVDVAVVYFAGHGVEVDGSNYVIPVDAKLLRDFDIEDETISVDRILKSIEPARRLRLVILDACRDNPFLKTMKRTVASRSVGRGLAKVEPALSDTLIAFAAKAGSVALDGDAKNSPFTLALLHNIASPGLDLRIAFGRVRDEVLKATNRRQEPFVYGSLGGSVISIVDAPKIPPPLSTDEIVWNAVKDSTFPAVFEEFLNKFPVSRHLKDAQLRRDELRKQIVATVAVPPPPSADEIVWNAIKDSRAPAIFEEYLSKFPESLRTADVKVRLEELKDRLVATAASPQSSEEIKRQHSASKGSEIGLKVLSDSDEASLKQKSNFRECEKCPDMIVVPAGSFLMGSSDNGPKRPSAESSGHRVTFGRAFAVGRFAVTLDEWDACVADGGCSGYKPWDNGWGRGKRPAINISWSDAKNYVAWLSERTGRPYRLLNEAEREYVTRAGTASPFWWGASVSRRQANYDDKASQDKTSKGSRGQKTVPVDSYQPNPWGLYQVHGNIWEWVEDCLNENYTGAPIDGTAWTTGHCDRRVLRGGSWVSSADAVEAGSRYGVQAEGRVSNVGFRVARTLKE